MTSEPSDDAAGRSPDRPPIVVIMGVSASGKTTVGRALAARLGCDYQEGDALHPPANVEKMRQGHALDDADRAPWLDRVAAWIGERVKAGESGVVACSALRHAYRDRLREADAGLAFVLLDPGEERLRDRIARRTGHYMPPSLLESQLRTLERPDASEHALTVHGDFSADSACDQIATWLRERARG